MIASSTGELVFNATPLTVAGGVVFVVVVYFVSIIRMGGG